MAEPAPGPYWHIHHDVLMEWCTGYTLRAAYIRETKPPNEIDTRLRLFAPVRGLSVELSQAIEQIYGLDRIWAVRNERYVIVQPTSANENDPTRAWHEYTKNRNLALAALDNAWAAFGVSMFDLHNQECPNCPWDGHTIFPK